MSLKPVPLIFEELKRKSMTIANKSKTLAICAALALLAATTGCKDECANSSDCGLGEICANGACVSGQGLTGEDINDLGVDKETSDVDSDTIFGTGSELEDTIANQTDNGTTATSNETENDSELEQCPAVLLNGEKCEGDCQCLSSHCQNGFCCDSGECCGDSGDCAGASCSAHHCSGNNQCIYNESVYGCGEVDPRQEFVCDGEKVCDGHGNCVQPEDTCGAYRRTGELECEENTASYRCFESCTAENQALNCATEKGAVCHEEQCIIETASGLGNGDVCTKGEECESGHCEGGICCAKGECCREAEDCDASSCVLRYCDGNSECDYYDVAPCGAEDLAEGDVCAGDSRCDGLGACATVESCDGAYKATGEYECTQGSVREVCFDSCSSAADCNNGYYCEEGACVGKIPNGEGPCTGNNECQSGYCTTDTGICCDEGWCCDQDSQCEDYVCDLATSSCVFSCRSGEQDDDALCAGQGQQHCDEGTCYADLENGETYCDEDSDCASGHCDSTSGICCDGGACCQYDDDCGGLTCDVDFHCIEDCSPFGEEIDALCSDGYHCDGDVCVADVPDGFGGCDEDGDCESGNCTEETGVCCEAGLDGCCNSNSQCDDGNPCTSDSCSIKSYCRSTPKDEGASCSDGRYCNGDERCVQGVCQAGDSPCDLNETFCTEVTCDEENKECIETPVNIGQACSDVLFCAGDVAMVCTETGLCADPETGTPPCLEETGNPCTFFRCNEETASCDEVPGPNGIVCGGEGTCLESICMDGVCVPGASPCDDGDPCTEDSCSIGDDGDPTCANLPKEDHEPCDALGCYGEGAYCLGGECIPDPSRPCIDDNICTVDDCAASNGEAACRAWEPDPVVIECGSAVSVTESDFVTREYYEYSDLCPGAFEGPEAQVVLILSEEADVTLAASNAAPSMAISFMLLSNMCDPETCTDSGSNELSLHLLAGEYSVVLEGGDLSTPAQVDITAICQ